MKCKAKNTPMMELNGAQLGMRATLKGPGSRPGNSRLSGKYLGGRWQRNYPGLHRENQRFLHRVLRQTNRRMPQPPCRGGEDPPSWGKRGMVPRPLLGHSSGQEQSAGQSAWQPRARFEVANGTGLLEYKRTDWQQTSAILVSDNVRNDEPDQSEGLHPGLREAGRNKLLDPEEQ